MQYKARFFDGTSLKPLEVICHIEKARFIIVDSSGETISAHPVVDMQLLYADRLGNRVDLGVEGLKDYRLMFEGPGLRRQLGIELPQVLHTPGGHGWGAAFKISAALAAFVAFLGLVAWQLDKVLPVFVPDTYAQNFGRNVATEYIEMFGGQCRDAAGEEALNAVVSRLTDNYNPRIPLTVRVANSPMVNAFALPGGQIVIFNGLIKEASSADEVAGVLAHEMGHVQGKHSLRGLTRAVGLGVIASIFTGSNVGDLTRHLVSMGFSREMEREADMEAVLILENASVDTRPLADFFSRLSEKHEADYSDMLSLLSSHPASAERALQIQNLGKAATTTPVIGADSWERLKRICGDAPEDSE